MKKWILSLTLAASVVGLAACGSNGSGGEVVVKTKAGNITQDELYKALKDKYGDQVLQQLIFDKVLSKKYKVSSKDVDKQVQQAKDQLGAQFESALAQYGYKDEQDFRNTIKVGLLEEKAATKDVKVTDKELRDYYNNIKPEIKARHILVADKKTADDIEKKLNEGQKFEDLAKKYSTDTGSAQKGGDLGWFGPGKMLPEFENAAYALKINEISKPVKSQYGYHIIQLTDKKKKESFEKMKKQITQEVKTQKVGQAEIAKAMKAEIKNANVSIKDKDLKSALDNVLNADTSSSGATK
ncbi:peptidylprolyl isomerase [Bacillus sp. FJAT-49736]|uniref:peptidylprolyl isomerase n=1 Tax=Bacillus sp. FJAT-49736 TaxID=2833582 RepID=UPI001BC9760C|nr:peptidylprolyl isomerase [Bacillus sp. FJAT-49736]MBS4171900.1 peptidylprolyl isomerase [Bacillus sp. FJAT-49736]